MQVSLHGGRSLTILENLSGEVLKPYLQKIEGNYSYYFLINVLCYAPDLNSDALICNTLDFEALLEKSCVHP